MPVYEFEGKKLIKVKNNCIYDIKFEIFGCPAAFATSSVLTELAKGKTLEEAEKITDMDVVKALGELPDSKMHCSVNKIIFMLLSWL